MSKTNGICHCGNGPGGEGTSGMDGCTHTEHSDEGKIENTSSDDDRIIFLLVYFGAIVLMCGCGKVAACCFGGEEADQFDPSCCSGDWLASARSA